MRLPPELRNQIYNLALVDENGIYLVSKTKRYRRTVERSVTFITRQSEILSRVYSNSQSQSSEHTAAPALLSLAPNLLLLNHAIHAETQPILYADNSFLIADTTAMHAFLANIGPKNRANITDLTIGEWGYSGAHKALNHPALTMLVDAVNLRRLNLECHITRWSNPKRRARQLYRAGFHWLEAVGAGKGKLDAALDIIEIPDGNLLSYHHSGRENGPTPDSLRKEFMAELRRLLSCNDGRG